MLFAPNSSKTSLFPKEARNIIVCLSQELFINYCQKCHLGRCESRKSIRKPLHLSPGKMPAGVPTTSCRPRHNSAMLWNLAAKNTKPDKHTLTNFSGDLGECLHTTLSIVAFWSQRWDVVPPKGRYNVNHGLCLVGVWWDHSREEVIPGVITQFWSCRCIADLRYLQIEWQVIQAKIIPFYTIYSNVWKA